MLRVVENCCHSKSLKVMRIYTIERGVCKLLLVNHYNHFRTSYRFWDTQHQIIACPWNLGERIIQDYWKWQNSIDLYKPIIYQSAIVGIALSCAIFKLLDTENVVTLKSRVGVTQRQWKWRHSIDQLYDFLFVFHCDYEHSLYRFGDKARYWLKNRDFSYPLLRNNSLGKTVA